MAETHMGQLFTMCCLLIFVISLYYLWLNIEYYYVLNREKHAINAFWSIKKYPNFWTHQGPIVITYQNTCSNEEENTRLSDFYICSAYKPYQVAGNTNDVCSLEGIKMCLDKGARFHYLTIWSSNEFNPYDESAEPVVRSDTIMGEPLTFDSVCETYSRYSWLDNNYPLLLYLDIETSANNKIILQKMKQIILKHMTGKLAPSKYSFSNDNIGNITIKEAMGTVIFIANIQTDHSIDELINGIINKQIQNSGTLIVYDKTHMKYGGIISKSSDTQSIIDKNRTHLGKVVRYEFNKAYNLIQSGIDLNDININDVMKYGYNSVFIHFSKPGKTRDDYINFFKNSSFILKEDGLRTIPCPAPTLVKQNSKASYAKRNMNVQNGYFTHNM